MTARPARHCRWAALVPAGAALLWWVGAPIGAAPPAVEAPLWMRQAAARALSPDQAAAAATVLLDDAATTVSRDGTTSTRRLYVARLRTREGRSAGTVGDVYLTDTGRIRSARGWIIRPSGDVQEIPATGVIDIALAPNDVYNEARMRAVSAGDTEPDTVFAAEIVAEDRAIFTQVEWTLQDRWPVAQARRTLTLPAGWSVSSVTFNHAAVEPVVSGPTRTWSVENLAELPAEPASPPSSSLAPRIAVSYTPAPPIAPLAVFDGWPSVSRWLAALSDPQAAGSDDVAAKARELTAGAATPAERIAAVAAWVQRVPYISIQIGVGRGGGYRPRRAADVFARNHGDCKDKATLMRALLAAIGIRSYPVTVYAGDRTAVREEWPSPHQFNHVILAVAVDDTAAFPAAGVTHPSLGPLLIFDPTDPYTRLGSLPDHEEGSLALVVHPEGSGLIRLPDPGAAAHASERTTDAALQPDGSLQAVVTRRTTGRFAASRRALITELDPRSYHDALATQLNATLPGVRVSDAAANDGRDAFEYRTTLAVPGYAQALPGGLVVVTPPFRAAAHLPVLASARRALAVTLDGASVSETLQLSLPAGLVVDELPGSATRDTPFGSFRLSARQEGARVVVERRLVVKRQAVPAADYGALKRFVDEVRSLDGSPIVLRRSPGPGPRPD